jgi:4-hydroxybenzoate polyprenyltransferase
MITPFLRLIRLPNLLIIALTMLLVRYCLIGKMLDLRGYWLGLSDLGFTQLVISVLCIAAGGYIINDYFDVQTDAINRPEKVTVGKDISRKAAFNLYLLLNGLGVVIGLYLAVEVKMYQLGLINLLSAGLLWFYTTTYQKRFLLGNLVISLLSGLIPLLPGLFEPSKEYTFGFLVVYASFAFVITLIREIIKDMEDLKGDLATGSRTAPIIIGIKASKTIAVVLCILLIAFLGFVEYNQYITRDLFSLYYFTGTISLPLVVLIVLTLRASSPQDFHTASILAKLIMLTGILSTVVFYISLS